MPDLVDALGVLDLPGKAQLTGWISGYPQPTIAASAIGRLDRAWEGQRLDGKADEAMVQPFRWLPQEDLVSFVDWLRLGPSVAIPGSSSARMALADEVDIAIGKAIGLDQQMDDDAEGKDWREPGEAFMRDVKEGVRRYDEGERDGI